MSGQLRGLRFGPEVPVKTITLDAPELTGPDADQYEIIGYKTSHRLALKVLENDERRGWQLLDQPSRLRIRTIDSLCSDLARQLPIVSGLGAGQQIAEDPQPLHLQAATRTMAAPCSGPAPPNITSAKSRGS